MTIYLKDMFQGRNSDAENLRSFGSVRSKMSGVLKNVKPEEKPWYRRPVNNLRKKYVSMRDEAGLVGNNDLPGYLAEWEQEEVEVKLEAYHESKSSVMEDGIFTLIVVAGGYEKVFDVNKSPKDSWKRVFDRSKEMIEYVPFDAAVGTEVIALLGLFDRFGE